MFLAVKLTRTKTQVAGLASNSKFIGAFTYSHVSLVTQAKVSEQALTYTDVNGRMYSFLRVVGYTIDISPDINKA